MESSSKKTDVYSIARSMLPQNFLRKDQAADYDIEQHLNMNMFDSDDDSNDLDIDMDQFNIDLFSPQQGIPERLNEPVGSAPETVPLSVPPPAPQTQKKKRKQDNLAPYKFGRTTSLQYPSIPRGSTPSYLPDFSPALYDSLATNTTHNLTIFDLPPRSRVETQINLSMFVHPPPAATLVHLPADTISKPKLQLRSPLQAAPELLMLETIVVCHSDPAKYVNICGGCINRERKRASRKKVRVPIDEAHWNSDRERRAIIFNCKEVVELSEVENHVIDGHSVAGKRLDLPMRIACYCRHHAEEVGFTAYITLRDYTGRVVAHTKTTPIMITDDHKALTGDGSAGIDTASVTPVGLTPTSHVASAHVSNNVTPAMTPLNNLSSPPTPPIERSTKKRKSSFSYNDSSSSLQLLGSESDIFTNTDYDTQHTEEVSQDQQSQDDDSLSSISRVIPSQGSIRGGIEITLLGKGFHDGLVVKFGDNFASTQCWSDTTIVAQLPATEVAGPVIVSFSGIATKNAQVFTYIDDTDRQLIELALQVVGLKMNGKLEDAKDIARRLIGGSNVNVKLEASTSQYQMEEDLVKLLSLNDYCLDDTKVGEKGGQSGHVLAHKNATGQTLLHLAAGLGYTRLVSLLCSRGVAIDAQDNSGFTPLHQAALRGKLDVVIFLTNRNANLFVESESGHYALDISDSEIRSYLMEIMYPKDIEEDSGSETETPRRRERRRRRRGITQYMLDLRNNARQWSGQNITAAYDLIASQFSSANPTAGTSDNSPPKYEDIFPDGSSIDYSAAVIEPVESAGSSEASWDRKTKDIKETEKEEATSTPSTTPADGPEPAQPMSEEEVMEAWKSKRTLLHQDFMFFLFWLPIFVALMYWAYLTLASSLTGYSSGWSTSKVRDTVLDWTLYVAIPKKHIHKMKLGWITK